METVIAGGYLLNPPVLSENQCGMIGEVVGCSLLVVGNAKIGYRPQEPVSPHFRSLFSLTLSFSPLLALSKNGSDESPDFRNCFS